LSGARRSPVCARWKFWQWRLTSCMFLHTLTHFSIERTILSADEVGGPNNLNLPQKWAPFYIACNRDVTLTTD
jgi:hypothetical protein